jgi:hypothetical protein
LLGIVDHGGEPRFLRWDWGYTPFFQRLSPHEQKRALLTGFGALVFGYSDNKAASELMAEILAAQQERKAPR